MKNVFILCFLFCAELTSAQKTTFKYIKESQLDTDLADEASLKPCDNNFKGNTVVFLKIAAVDPTAKDEEKSARIAEVDKVIEGLEVYNKCTATQTVIIQLGEALFINSKDKIEIYSKKYESKGRQLNAERFWNRYRTKLENYFPGKTIVLADWGW
jgi:hypothetical protein